MDLVNWPTMQIDSSPKAFLGLVPNERNRFGALGRQTYCDEPGQALAVASPESDTFSLRLFFLIAKGADR